ncbi:hypothetical protein F4774DRAFT_410225 [Daldinia eschscholtzii]|nr:hypothetical protein F4774DRAFT_410225 [Daldinia eschscholtzii]
MSLLNVLIPVPTLASLIEDICKQIDAGRLEVNDAPSNKKPTSELSQLITLLGQKLNRDFKSHTLIKMDSLEDFYLDEIEGEKCIFCIRRNQSGPAIWTDMVRKCRIEENNISLIEEGYLHAEGDDGGIYLILWPLKEPEGSSATQEPQERPDKRQLMNFQAPRNPADKARELTMAEELTTLDDCKKQSALWEKLDREIRRGKKRGGDLIADSTSADADEDYADLEGMLEEMAQAGMAEIDKRVRFLVEEASKNAGPAARNPISTPNRVHGSQEKGRRPDSSSEVIPAGQQNKRQKIRKSM